MRDQLRAYLASGILIGGGGVILALANPPGTTSHVVSVCSAGIGGLLVLGVIVVTRLMKE